MAKYKSIVITNAGLELVAAAHSGGTIEFTCIKTGSGIYDGSEVLADMAALKSVKQTFGVTGLIRDTTVIKVRSSLTNNDLAEGYSITEIGLYAMNPKTNSEILYAIVVAESGMEDYLPAYIDSPQSITFEMHIAITDSDNVSFIASIVPGTYVTVEDFNDFSTEVDSYIKTISTNVNKTSEDLTSHTGNKNNPHGVTKAQVGLGNVNNTSDKNKPISDATQAALDTKADETDLTSHTGNKNNPHSVTKTQVGLENVDNTSDKDKPVSTEQKSAIDNAETNAKNHADTQIKNALTQNLKMTDDAGVTKTVIELLNPSPDTPQTGGSEILLRGGGNVFCGAGESSANLRNALANADTLLDGEYYSGAGERNYISADAGVYIYSNCNTIESRKGLSFYDGKLYPTITGQLIDLGVSDKPFNKGYINELIGNLTGGINVQVVKTANTNLDDYTTTGIYQFSGSYTPTNIPSGSNGWLIVIPVNTNLVKQFWTRQGTTNSNNHNTYERTLSNGVWANWSRFITDKDMATTSANGIMSKEDKAKLDNEVANSITDNLLPYPYYHGSSKTVNGITTTIDENGWAYVKGTASAGTSCFDFTYRDVEFPAGTYTISGVPEGASSTTYRAWFGIYKSGTTTEIKSSQVYAEGVTFTVDEPFTMIFRVTVVAGAEVDVIYKPMLEKGTVAHPYQPHNLSRQKLRDDAQELHNKTAIFFGDSITWGELGEGDGTRVSKPYPTVFADVTGCNVINAGVRGATASSTETKNFAAQITSQKVNIPNADYAFVCFGVNDFSKAVTVGNASTAKSFYADYLAAIKGILIYNPNIEIIVILPPRGKGYTDSANWKNDNGDIFDSYVNAIIEIATNLNLRIVDFGKVGINSYITSNYYVDDNHHLTQEGYTLLGEHLAKAYKTGTYESKREFYNKAYRVATNQLGTMPFPNPVDIQGNSYYDGVYWSILGTDTAGITSYKNVQIIKGEDYHFEFLTFHRDKANNRTVTYTITMTNVSDTSIKYVFKKTLTCVYERLHFDFNASNASGFYTINIVAEGDNVYIASPSLSYGGIIPESRKRKIGNVSITSTNTMTVDKNKFVNGEFIFNMRVTADKSTTNLARVDLNTSNSGDTSAYLPTGDHYFVGMDITDKKTVPMYWSHDGSNPGQYLLKVLSGIETNHVYVANHILYMAANNAVHEVIAQEY